jgi:oligopeptide transport system permease protein
MMIRFVNSLLTLFLLLGVTFLLLRLAPGGPFDSDHTFPPEIKAAIDARYGLDQPIQSQFKVWLSGLAHGDLAESFQYLDRPVVDIIRDTLPISLRLGAIAFSFALVFGVLLACFSVMFPSCATGIMILSSMGLSLPSYLLASSAILIFSLYLGWLPVALLDAGWTSWVLPSTVLGFRPMAIIVRFTRASLLEEVRSGYARAAIAKGLSPGVVIFKHVLANSLIPLISLLGPILANLLTGSFLIESIFQLPGLGKHFVTAVINRDYPLVMGVTLTYGIFLILFNLGSDLLYSVADPRIRRGLT